MFDILCRVVPSNPATAEVHHLHPKDLPFFHPCNRWYLGVPPVVGRKLLLAWLLLHIYRNDQSGSALSHLFHPPPISSSWNLAWNSSQPGDLCEFSEFWLTNRFVHDKVLSVRVADRNDCRIESSLKLSSSSLVDGPHWSDAQCLLFSSEWLSSVGQLCDADIFFLGLLKFQFWA